MLDVIRRQHFINSLRRMSDIPFDSIPECELRKKEDEEYPKNWFAKRSSLYWSNNALYGNWSRTQEGACGAPWSKPIEKEHIYSITSLHNCCSDGQQIIMIILNQSPK